MAYAQFQRNHHVSKKIRAGGLDAVVINTSGCGTTVKDYGNMFAGGPLADDAAQVAALARDMNFGARKFLY